MITTAKQLRTLADRTGLDAIAEVLRDAASMVERLEERVQELEQAPTFTAAKPVAYALFTENGNIRIWSQQPLEISGVVPLYVHSPFASVTQPKPPGDATPAATETEVLREALTEARNWFEQQARAVSKACGSSYELHDLRVQRDALDAALASAAQPAPAAQGDAPQLDAIRQAIRDYHFALDQRQHGGVAAATALIDIQIALDMSWKQGAEAAARAAKEGTQP